MKFVLSPAVWPIATVAMLAVACDRDSPSNDSGGSPVVLRGGERLGWDQPAAPGTNPSFYGYIMYVDGWANTLSNVSCDGSASSRFNCSSLLPSMSPGRHSLTLVASQGAAMSAPSRALQVTVVVASVPTQQILVVNSVAQPSCTGSGRCYRSIEIVRSSGVISTPVSALNDRILFVVDGRQIQSVSPTSTAANLLLNIESPAARILSIAVPDGGSLVWVTSVETRVDGTRLLAITRYRLVEDTLGEPATVVSMSIPEVEPRVVVDSGAYIYIAMPSSRTTNASVLRLMDDGTTPRSQLSPELLTVPPELRAIALAPDDRLWISGVDNSGRWQLGRIEPTDASMRFQSVPAADDHQRPGADITSLAFTHGSASPSESSVLVVANGMLYRASADGFPPGSMQPVPWARGTPIEVAAADVGIFVVSGTLNDRSIVYSLFRFIP